MFNGGQRPWAWVWRTLSRRRKAIKDEENSPTEYKKLGAWSNAIELRVFVLEAEEKETKALRRSHRALKTKVWGLECEVRGLRERLNEQRGEGRGASPRRNAKSVLLYRRQKTSQRIEDTIMEEWKTKGGH